MSKPYEFKIAGLDADGKIIVLVKDDQYTDFTLAVNIGDIENEQIEIQYDFLSNNEVPISRQQEVVQDVVQFIFAEIESDL